MTDTTFSGSCLCGSVQFSFAAPSLWCAHCHCTMCQRAHGAALVTWVGVDEKGLQFNHNGQLHWHPSSADSERGFCRECGSTLFFRSERWPGEVHIARANVDGEIDRLPASHAHWESHVDWCEVDDSLPRHTT